MVTYYKTIVIKHSEKGLDLFNEWLIHHNLENLVYVTPFSTYLTFIHFKDDQAYTMLCLKFRRSIDNFPGASNQYEQYLIDVNNNVS